MKRILMIFILLVAVFSRAQESQNNESVLLEKISNLKNSGDVNSEKYANDLNNLAVFYHNIKDYHRAEPLYLQSLDIYKKLTGETPPGYLNSLKNLAVMYQVMADYQKAEIVYIQAFNLNTIINGELDKSNIQCLINIIAVSILNKNFNKSHEYYLKILKLQESIYGTNHPEYVNTLFNIGYNLCNLKILNEAEGYFLKAIEIDEIIKDKNSLDYSKSLSHLYRFYMDDKLNYEKAEFYLNQIIKIKKTILGVYNNDYLNTNSLLGFLKENKREFDAAYEIFYDVLQKSSYIKNETYFTAYDALVRVVCKMNDFNKSEDICKKYLIEVQTIQGKNSEDYLQGLFYLASEYEKNDILYLAQKYYEEIIDIKKSILKEDKNTIYPAYESLANIYKKIGNLQLAEDIHRYVLEEKIKNNVSNEILARSYSNLATVYDDELKYDLAEINYLKAIELIKKDFGEYRYDYASYVSNLGSLYIGMNKFSEAEEYLLQSLKIKEKLIGQFNDNYLLTCSNLAALYEKTGRCKEAEKYYLVAINNCLNKNSKEYKSRFLNLSNTYNCLNDIEKEKKYLIKSSEIFKNEIINICSYYSTNDIIFLNDNLVDTSPFSFSFIFRNPSQNEIIESAINNDLLLKNILLRNQKRIYTSIQKSGNKQLLINYNKFINNKKQISKLNELPRDKLPKSYEQLITDTEQLEKDLVHQSAEFSNAKSILSVEWRQIKESLKPNEVVIDLVAFDLYDKKITGSIMYCAYIFKKDYKIPKVITLFEEKQLESIRLINDETNKADNIDKIYINKSIKDLFFEPLKKELDGVTTIYLSPSGLGHQIDFSALPVTANQILGEKYKLHILNSPAELLDYKVTSLEKKSKIELLLYGGIDYTKSIGNVSLSVNDNSISSNEDFINSAKRSDFEKLPGTLKEVNGINANANKSGFNSKIFKESEATEESIKALDGRTIPYVLHLATHGFFFPDPIQDMPKDILSSDGKSKIYKGSEDPMMRSGLLLAGAKNYWGKSNPNNTIENGILTASEISNLDLSACQLVVLSACETGLGEVKGSEGVFGLQRAFKMAGVKNIIMSLWKVPDTQTAELFDIFYSECFAGKSIHEAFQSAQSQMKAKYSPYYWAGFVLLE